MVIDKRITLHGLLQVVALATVAASFFALLGGLNFLFELFAHFRLQYFLLAMFCSLYFFIQGHWIEGLAMSSVAGVNVKFLLPFYLALTAPVVENPEHLKILHSNVYTLNSRHDLLVKLIEREQPDVVVVQEVEPNWYHSLEALHPAYPYRVLSRPSDYIGVGVYSKYPLEEATIEGWGLAKRTSIVARIAVGNKHLSLVTTHPPPPLNPPLYEIRNSQLLEAAERAAKMPEPVILVGDFNITPWCSSYQQFISRSKLHNARLGQGLQLSWPSFMPLLYIPIDHILVSDAVVVESIYTGAEIGSDHLPLIAELAF